LKNPNSKGKTVRFTNIVERSGTPRVHTLWLPPEKDPELKRAEAAHRVMTIASPGDGSKTDRGVVGFDPHAGKVSQFLIFPKSLKRFEGAKVVGIKFDLLEQPKLAPADPLKSLTASPAKRRGSKKTTPSKPTATRATRATADFDKPAETTKSASDPKVVSFELPEPTPSHAPAPAPTSKTARSQKKAPRAAKSKADGKSKTFLVREIRAAMKELKAGKAVAAYQRLQNAAAGR
jgi:hypothetical protein